MDTIIGLLFVLVPVILTVVSKRLEKAGKDGDEVEVPSMSEVFPPVSRHMTDVDEGMSSHDLKQPVPQQQPKKKLQPHRDPAFKVKEEENPRKKEKLDPKKLVIYSEIMKPKF
jgi:hypothetical protein